jgi:rRNA biogenesis protein RRP5
LPAKKMKFLFRRYLDYEKAHGDTAGVERVRGAARAYVESNLAA